MSLRISLVVCIVMLGCCHAASAELIVSADMDPVADGIQSHREVMIGDEFDVGIVFQLTDSSSLGGYFLSVRFNADVVELRDREETYPPGFMNIQELPRPEIVFGTGTPSLGGGTYGELGAFEAATFGEGIEGPWSFEVATLTFRAKDITTSESLTHVLPGMFDEADSFGDSNLETIEPSFQGGSVTVVPEPSSLVLLATALSVLFGVIVYRRRTGR